MNCILFLGCRMYYTELYTLDRQYLFWLQRFNWEFDVSDIYVSRTCPVISDPDYFGLVISDANRWFRTVISDGGRWNRTVISDDMWWIRTPGWIRTVISDA